MDELADLNMTRLCSTENMTRLCSGRKVGERGEKGIVQLGFMLILALTGSVTLPLWDLVIIN